MAGVRIPVHVRTLRTRGGVNEAVRVGADDPSQERASAAAQASEPVALAPVCQEHEDLLEDVLSIADDLERALAAADEETPIREGVAITHRGVMHILRKHGIERMEAEQQPFDPNWHEAIDVVSADRQGVDPGTVVEVLSSGYRRGAQLYRPARVVVAQ